MQTENTSHRISVFLDVPGAIDEKSKVFIRFYLCNELQDVAAALDYLKTKSPIPLLLRPRKKDENTCIEVECLNTPKMIFGFNPPSNRPEEDLNEIVSWFRQNNIEVKLVQ